MSLRTLTGGAVAIAALLIGGQGAARASYAPSLAVQLQPATPGTAAGVTSTLTQASGETANKTIRVHYPAQFGFNPGFAVTGCPASAERTNSCPADSQIGSASVETILGTSSGPVYLTGDFQLLIYLRSLEGLLQQKVVGYFQVTADGGVDTVLDNLPAFPATSSTVTLQPGSKSLLLTPRACGPYTIVGHFSSQRGDQVTSSSNVQISGCDSQPRIGRIWLTPAVLHWSLSEPGARTVIQLERLRSVDGIESRHLLWSRVASASKGINSMSFQAATGGRPLPAGDYRFALKVASTRRVPTDTRSITFKRRR